MKHLCLVVSGLLLAAGVFLATSLITKTSNSRGWSTAVRASQALSSQMRPPDGVSRLPALQGTCGSGWQEQYRQLHAGILAGAVPPRYLAFRCPEGLADTLRTAAGLFFVAVLSKRALLIDMLGDNRLEWALGQPNVNWTLPFDPDSVTLGPGLPDNNSLYLNNPYGKEFQEMIGNETLTAFGGRAEVVFMHFCGYTHTRLADNIHHSADIYGMGLSPDSMFACAMEFLFQLQPDVLDLFQHEITTLTTTTALRVGIQIRAGDWAFHPEKDNYTVEQYQQFFDCAEEVHRTRSTPGQQHIYYLISDSHHLRMDALRVFGNVTLLTNTATRLGHVAKSGTVDATGFMPPEEVLRNKRQQLVAAAGEFYLFGLADVYIYSISSGFGAWGAARARKWNNHYIIDTNATAPRRSCGLQDFDREVYKLDRRSHAYLHEEELYRLQLEQNGRAQQQQQEQNSKG